MYSQKFFYGAQISNENFLRSSETFIIHNSIICPLIPVTRLHVSHPREVEPVGDLPVDDPIRPVALVSPAGGAVEQPRVVLGTTSSDAGGEGGDGEGKEKLLAT